MEEPQEFYKSRIRAPLLWILAPLILGYFMGSRVSLGQPSLLLAAGITLFIIWGFYWLRHQAVMPLNWKLIGVVSIILTSWSYYAYRTHPKPESMNLPDREVQLAIKVKQVLGTEDKYGRLRGYGTVTKTPQHLKDLEEKEIYFFLKPASNQLRVFRGQTVSAKGVLKRIKNEDNSTFHSYLNAQGIYLEIYRGKILDIKKEANFLYQFFHKQKEALLSILKKGNTAGTKELANIYVGMLLGEKGGLSKEQKGAFQKTGTLHLFAISGLHVGVIAACLAFALKFLKIRVRYSAVIGLIILFLYVQITGGAASAMRAFLMIAFYWGARAFFRKKDAFSALLGSAFLMLVIQPEQLWNIGFQFSYAVVGSILLYGLPLNESFYKYIEKRFNSDKRKYILQNVLCWAFSLFSISLAANLISIPISLYYFQIFTPGAVLLNMFLVPLASLIIAMGFIS